MNIDCQWIEKNLEAMFSNDLPEQEHQHARAHIEQCQDCRQEVQALIAIDPLIKKYFQAQLARAMRSGGAPVLVRRTPRWAFRAAAVAVVAIVLTVLLRVPQAPNLPSEAKVETAAVPAITADSGAVEKSDSVTGTERAKPSPSPATPAVPNNVTPRISANAPAFLVTDPAGYSHSLENYRGFTVLIGVWSPDHPDSIAHMERLYKAHGTNPQLRFIGATYQRTPKPTGTTFPVFYNEGSRLLDARPDDFVLLNESGTVTSRGSLADFERLSRLLLK
jgi:hypothetical protein